MDILSQLTFTTPPARPKRNTKPPGLILGLTGRAPVPRHALMLEPFDVAVWRDESGRTAKRRRWLERIFDVRRRLPERIHLAIRLLDDEEVLLLRSMGAEIRHGPGSPCRL